MARGIENGFIEDMRRAGVIPLPYPWQNALTRSLRTAGSETGDSEVLSLWAGQGSALASERSVQGLIDSLEVSLRDVLRSLSTRQVPAN